MDFFDGLIEETKSLLSHLGKREYPYERKWTDVGRNTLVLKRDEAYELDGIGFNLITSKPIGESGVTVIGRELNEIKGETKFARISLIETDADGDEQKLYDTIRKIEYAKYHYFPKGFMVRSISSSSKENVRVTRDALKQGITFSGTGGLLIGKYLENPCVKNARIIYVTDPRAYYKGLEAIAEKNYGVTETLNHIMENIPLDCSACRLKPICDEVEGMRELHFKKAKD